MQEMQSEPRSPFRLDVQLHELLTKPQERVAPVVQIGKGQTFPDPVFPQRPELLGPIDLNDGWTPPESAIGHQARSITR